jgi:hypothetical protein
VGPFTKWEVAHRGRVGEARERFVGKTDGRKGGEDGSVVGEYEKAVVVVAKVSERVFSADDKRRHDSHHLDSNLVGLMIPAQAGISSQS